MGLKPLFKKIRYWLEPKCDICGKTEEDEFKNPIQSDGVGMIAHLNCWRDVLK